MHKPAKSPARKYLKTYVVKHGRGWKYKRAVPADLQACVRKKVWTRYLGATSEADAEHAGRKLSVEHADLIRRLRALTAAERADIASKGGIGELAVLADDTGAAFVEAAARGLEPDPSDDDATQATHALQSIRTRREAQQIRETATRARRLLSRLTPGDKASDLDSLIPVWMLTNKARSDHTMRLHVRRFVSVIGNLPPDRITRAHVGAFRDVLEADTTLSRRTVAKHLDSLHALFAAAASKLKMDSNPAAGVKVSKAGGKFSDQRGKGAFTAEQARMIFAAVHDQPLDFQWMTRLCAYTGARSGELAQLRVDDVTTLEGVPVLRIHDKYGALKNKFSMRDIPIPPALSGIVAYAQSRTGPWLFADYPAHRKRSRGTTFQHVASDFLRHGVGILDPTLTWHSWRHRFRTICREIDMPEPVSRALMGHSQGAGEHGAYGSVPSLAKRAEWIGKVYPLA